MIQILDGATTLCRPLKASEKQKNIANANPAGNSQMLFQSWPIGALKRIKQQGLRVPEDISLVGFDDIPFAAYCDPALTSIAQPAEIFGQKAVEMLIALMR